MFLPIFKIAQSNIRLKKTIVSIDRVYDILNQKSSIKQELPFFYGNIERGTIIFKNVSFSYAPDLMLFNELNLDIQENCFNGIVGESGEGKSTLVNLIMRLWDVNKGSITVDGIDISRYEISKLRNSIALVSQDLFMSNDTIMNNLTFMEENIKMTEVIKATKQVKIYDFIMSLSDGFNTEVGENGIKLSGGQKQRIAIARAILRKTKVIIFDEATASLDNNVQDHIINNMFEIFENRTVIIIAHRLSTIKKCDVINVIKDGYVVEKGKHEELLKNKGDYYHMYIKN